MEKEGTIGGGKREHGLDAFYSSNTSRISVTQCIKKQGTIMALKIWSSIHKRLRQSSTCQG